jgi:hypothetical protein
LRSFTFNKSCVYWSSGVTQKKKKNELGEVPEDILDDLDNLNENNTENDEVNNVGINDKVGVGDFDYDIDDILGLNNDEEDVMIDSER